MMKEIIFTEKKLKHNELNKLFDSYICKAIYELEEKILNETFKRVEKYGRTPKNKLSQETIEEIENDCKENTEIIKLEYKDTENYILSNGINGGFEYFYEINLLEDKLFNMEITKKFGYDKTTICYLLNKINKSKPGYAIYFSISDRIPDISYKIIIIEFK